MPPDPPVTTAVRGEEPEAETLIVVSPFGSKLPCRLWCGGGGGGTVPRPQLSGPGPGLLLPAGTPRSVADLFRTEAQPPFTALFK